MITCQVVAKWRSFKLDFIVDLLIHMEIAISFVKFPVILWEAFI